MEKIQTLRKMRTLIDFANCISVFKCTLINDNGKLSLDTLVCADGEHVELKCDFNTDKEIEDILPEISKLGDAEKEYNYRKNKFKNSQITKISYEDLSDKITRGEIKISKDCLDAISKLPRQKIERYDDFGNLLYTGNSGDVIATIGILKNELKYEHIYLSRTRIYPN